MHARLAGDGPWRAWRLERNVMKSMPMLSRTHVLTATAMKRVTPVSSSPAMISRSPIVKDSYISVVKRPNPYAPRHH